VGRVGIELITTVIFAKMPAPSDFGLVGMVFVIIGFVGIFRDMGTSPSVIQRGVGRLQEVGFAL